MFIVINALDAVLLSSYSFVMMGARYGLLTPNDITISLVTSTTGYVFIFTTKWIIFRLISLIHTAMNILFHEEYRRQICKFTRRFIGLQNATTTNITPNFVPTRNDNNDISISTDTLRVAWTSLFTKNKISY